MTEGPEIVDDSSADILTDRDAVTSARRVRVVVTGSRGFIGSHICDAFIAKGCDVIGIDNGVSRVDHTPPGATRIDRDIRLIDARDLAGADVVVHAAAYADVRGNWDSIENRARLMHDNVVGTSHVIECTPPSATVVFLSTAAVYGSQKTATWNHSERDFEIEDILSPYAASKLAGEAFLAAYGRKTKRRWYALRLVNVIGARTHHGVVSDFVAMMQRDRRIHAIDNGKQRKSWVHVADVAGAITALAGDISAPSGVYNVASLQDRISWWDVVEEMNVPRTQVTYEDRDSGHIGDPVDLTVSSRKLAKYFRCDRPVRAGIRDALLTLGWR